MKFHKLEHFNIFILGMIRKLFIQILIALCLPFMVYGQDVVGMHSDSIKILMKNNYPDLSLNTSSINKTYNYLKYEDFMGSQTVLMFLSDSNTCRYVKQMCSYNLFDQVVDSLNNNYERVNDTLWKFNVQQIQMTKQLKKQDWFFTVLTKRKE